ncbi:MAG: hypothetical protein ACI88H_002069 [Cocleimonas sp.]|jgi:hypothetical protein
MSINWRIKSNSKQQACYQFERRQFISQILSISLLPSVASSVWAAKERKQQEIIIGAQGAKPESYSLASLWSDPEPEREHQNNNNIPSNFRGHDVCQHPLYKFKALMFSRRPGYIGIEVDLLNNLITKEFTASKDRHFFGHGCFNHRASALFTTEADMKTGRGKIGVRDSVSYAQIGEFESHGIDPHQLALMPDGNTLVVANGGIHTHPNSGREKLNLDSMDSNLSYIDINNGKLLGSYKVPDSKASIRHLDVSSDGTVAFAMQYQRSIVTHNNIIPLAGIHAQNKALQLLNNPEPLIQRMNDYVGSVAISQTHKVAGFTSPRGGIVVFWDTENFTLKGYHTLADVCGIALSDDESHFIISNSFGQLRWLDASTLVENKTKRKKLTEFRWDNHLSIATIPS